MIMMDEEKHVERNVTPTAGVNDTLLSSRRYGEPEEDFTETIAETIDDDDVDADEPILASSAPEVDGADNWQGFNFTSPTVNGKDDDSEILYTINHKEEVVQNEEYWQEVDTLPTVIAAKMMPVNQFKNRYLETESRYIIEVLRDSTEPGDDRCIAQQETDFKLISKGDGLNDPWIQRVRIQSEHILSRLQDVSNGRVWDVSQPLTFCRPFGLLIYFHQSMKKSLQTMEAEWAVEKPEQKEPTKIHATGHEGENDISNEATETTDQRRRPPTALRHMRCYIEFVDKEIMPLYTRFNDPAEQKVRFSDLWMLFKIGEIIYSKPDADEPRGSSSSASMRPTAWRVRLIGSSIIGNASPNGLHDSDMSVDIHCYYVDYDGEAYGAVSRTFQITYFEGEKDITSLAAYPIRFAKDDAKLRAHLYAQGRRFRSFVKERHLLYKGPTLLNPPTKKSDCAFNNPGQIESDMIIDFAEGFQRHPSWKPEFYTTFGWDQQWKISKDEIGIRYWTGPNNPRLVEEVEDRMLEVDCVVSRQGNDHLKTDPFLSASKNKKVTHVGEKDLILLPRCVVAYSLREKRFMVVDIWSLRMVTAQVDMFRDLKINTDHKYMIKAMVRAHIQKQELQKRTRCVDLSQDLIHGKGSGLVVLLHGPPGVGKTATAEAVAKASKKPLFTITSGEIGHSPREAEEALNSIFYRAHMWDCMLLLDDADVFLSRRDSSDFKKNAVVSVFLRHLEYFNGILFLTTNRVGTLDEAFKSRIHVSLYYEPLDKTQALGIFQVNIDKLKRMEAGKYEHLRDDGYEELPLRIHEKSIIHYADWYFDNNPHARWNGRQIQKLFEIASSLAQYDMHQSSPDDWEDEAPSSQSIDGDLDAISAGRILNWSHFDMAAESIEKFDMYMEQTTGLSDPDIARKEHIRADAFEYHTAPARPEYLSSRGNYSRGRGSRDIRGARAPHLSDSMVHRSPTQAHPSQAHKLSMLNPNQGLPPSRRGSLNESPGRQGLRRRYQPPQATPGSPKLALGERRGMATQVWDQEDSVPSEDYQVMAEGQGSQFFSDGYDYEVEADFRYT